MKATLLCSNIIPYRFLGPIHLTLTSIMVWAEHNGNQRYGLVGWSKSGSEVGGGGQRASDTGWLLLTSLIRACNQPWVIGQSMRELLESIIWPPGLEHVHNTSAQVPCMHEGLCSICRRVRAGHRLEGTQGSFAYSGISPQYA